MGIIVLWLIVVLGGIVAAILVFIFSQRVSPEVFSRFGQGIAGIAAAGGILAGGFLFIAEGRTQPRLLLQVTSTVLGTAPTAGPQQSVYVQVVTTIENQGLLSPATIRCAAFDAFAIGAIDARVQAYANDLALPSLLRAPGAHGADWAECLRTEAEDARKAGEEARQAHQRVLPYVRPESGFRWANFDLHPGQIKTRNYELIVPCSLSGIRVLVKIPDPTGGVLERKVVVSIANVCRGERARDVTTIADAEPPLAPVPDAAAPARAASTRSNSR